MCVFTGERASLGALAVSVDTNHGRKLLVGGFAGYGYPELFSIPGESKREIFHSLMLQKLPDMLILMLLFVPSTSRRFFQLQ